jgi:hypothetical protein
MYNKLILLKFTLKFIFLTILFSYQCTSAQTRITLSGNAGLVTADGDLGRAFSPSFGISTGEKSGLEFNYSYIEIENHIESVYKIHRYSLLAEHFIYSDDKRFALSGKLGPSLLAQSAQERDSYTVLGLDFGLEVSYKLFGPLFIDFGVINTLNKTTTLITQVYIGFAFDINFKNDN